MLGQADRVFLCDVGGVVVPWDQGRADRQLSVLACGEVDARALKLAGQFFGGELWRQYSLGQVTDGEVCEALREQFTLAESVTNPQIRQAVSDVFYLPSQEVLALLHDLREKSEIPTMAVSNIEPMREKRLWHAGVWIQFEGSVLSHRVGALKPDPEIFEAALKMARVSRDKVLFVDDTLGHVQAAQALGITSHLFTTPEALRVFLQEHEFLPTPKSTTVCEHCGR